MRLLTLIALLLLAGPILAQKVPPPSDFVTTYVDGAKAYKACSPPVALRLAAAHRSGHLKQLPNPARFVELVAEEVDPVCVYGLDNLPFLRDRAAFDEFSLHPDEYVPTGRRPDKKAEFEFGPVVEPNGQLGVLPGFEPRKGPLEKEVAGFPVWVLGCVAILLLCVMRRRKQEASG